MNCQCQVLRFKIMSELIRIEHFFYNSVLYFRYFNVNCSVPAIVSLVAF